MTILQYTIYYKFEDNPNLLRQPKSEEQIRYALSRVKPEVEAFIGDDQAQVTVESSTEPHSINLKIKTSFISEDAALQSLTHCLNGLQLFGKRVAAPK